jgi:hypothetical protein
MGHAAIPRRQDMDQANRPEHKIGFGNSYTISSLAGLRATIRRQIA